MTQKDMKWQELTWNDKNLHVMALKIDDEIRKWNSNHRSEFTKRDEKGRKKILTKNKKKKVIYKTAARSQKPPLEIFLDTSKNWNRIFISEIRTSILIYNNTVAHWNDTDIIFEKSMHCSTLNLIVL